MGGNGKVVPVDNASDSDGSDMHVDRRKLHSFLPPHDSYEGKHRFDPEAEWTPAEERGVVRKTDFILLPWLCLMVSPVSCYHLHADGSPDDVKFKSSHRSVLFSNSLPPSSWTVATWPML